MQRVAPATSVLCSRLSERCLPAVVVGVQAVFAKLIAWSIVLSIVLSIALAMGAPGSVEARPFFESVGTVSAAQLPEEGRQVLAAIHAGGPFGSRRDGIPFGNREGVLPRRERGYYAEYTVPTPGARTRGARRIIAGRGRTGDFRTSDEYYYTNDHYETFRRILQ